MAIARSVQVSIDSRISRLLFSLLFGCTGFAAIAQPAADQELIERIRPVGEVCIQGSDCTRAVATAETAVEATAAAGSPANAGAAQSAAAESAAAPPATTAEVAGANSSRGGKEIHDRFCFACHDAGVAGAPKTGVASDWEPRLAQGRAVVLANAVNGRGAMPPRGTCMDCSEQELDLAIEHMISASP